MILGEYLADATRTPWVWGDADCCAFPADWAVTWGRGDPMAEWRGLYGSEDEARALISDAGGLIRLWERGLSAIGVGGVEAQPGDVGVVRVLTDKRTIEEVGAICLGRRWAMRAPAGIISTTPEVVRAWGPR